MKLQNHSAGSIQELRLMEFAKECEVKISGLSPILN